ncbi:MAG: NAD(P)H-binding protein [Ilumatobacter sp.]|uniref:NAD(P)H-binding protein n=1 Tax=Ilumatobacter sp. TaxID=1967498 RepID=UPI003919EA20
MEQNLSGTDASTNEVAPPRRVVVTGAFGNVGAAVVTALIDRGVEVRAAERHPGRVAERFPGIEAVRLDFEDPTTFAAAAADADAVFLIRPPAIARVGPTINRFVDSLAQTSVEHVVFSSVAGADTNKVVPHHRIEQHLLASGLAWTLLRPGFFSQNIGGPYRDDVVVDDRLYVPAARGRVAFVDARDLGEAAAIALCDPSYRGRALHLTGPVAVTFDDVAVMLSNALERTIRYEPASVLGYLRHRRRRGDPLVQCVVQTVLHVGLRRGDAEEVTDVLAEVLDRPPRSVREYLADHRDLFVASEHSSN